jgi:CheY-like chemotaxis protein/anti-sigma regulatory factor (Ser/Thr protein kinase)
LASERDASIAANIAKSKFIASASHDLRQPMHAVNVYLDLIDPNKLPQVEQLSFSRIKQSITTLNDMFEALLNISKLDAHVTQANDRVFNLIELIDSIRDSTESQANAKGLEFVIHPHNINVLGDKILLQQILINLIANAIQYTSQGRVEVSFDLKQQHLIATISDTGCGISKDEQGDIFNEFYRSDRTRSQHDGLGLGLSIVKRLSDLIGASISVTSEINHGSRFTVSTTYPITATDRSLPTINSALFNARADRSLHGKHIAIFEDDSIIIDAYKQTLSLRGAIISILSEYDDELQRQLSDINRIDCILSDHRLRHTTGDVIIQKLRENYNYEIPAIIVTADTSPAHISLFNELNVPVLHKPISFAQVAQAIEQLLDTASKP